MSKISSNELFIQKSLQFHIGNINEQNQISLPYDNNFGILNLTAISANLSKEEHDFIFMIDCSGSMDEPCSDGRSKMQHIIHTLKNMILYFKENSSIKVNITINSFDDKIHQVLERSPVNDDNYASIIEKIEKTYPQYSTDIGLALSSVKKTVDKIKEEFPSHNIVNIFMTDGDATAGNSNYKYLSELVDRSITNAFIGFGIDHDAALLNAVSNGENSSYHFIDKLENAGLVYGEILHGVVYKLLKNVTISVHNGLIYNYKNNTWVKTISVGEIVSESKKTYHIASTNPDDCVITLKAEKISNDDEDSNADYSLVVLKNEEDTDLTKYIYRQRTLQHLFVVNDFLKRKNSLKIQTYHQTHIINPYLEPQPDPSLLIDNEKDIKHDLRIFIEEMKKYMEDNDLQNDKLMKNLCDDIYICYRTFGTKFGAMYTTARQTSQGTQRCYNVSHTPDIIDDVRPMNPKGLSRQTSQSYRASQNIYCDTQEYDEINMPPPPKLKRQTNDPNMNYGELHHELSNFTDSPYHTLGVTQMMRDISYGIKNDAQTNNEYNI